MLEQQAQRSRSSTKSTKRFIWGRRLWFRKESKQIFLGDLDGACQIVPEHIALNIFDAMYSIEQQLWRLDATKLYILSKPIAQQHQLDEFKESLMADHQSDYHSKLNASPNDSTYVLGEAIKHTLSRFYTFVPLNVRDAFMKISDDKDVIAFLDMEDWNERSGKFVMGILVHLAKVSFLLSRRDPHKISLSVLSSIFSEILFPRAVHRATESAIDKEVLQNAKMLRLSMILIRIHEMMPLEAFPTSSHENTRSVIKPMDASHTDQCSAINIESSPIKVASANCIEHRRINLLNHQHKPTKYLNAQFYADLVERAQNRILIAKLTSTEVNQALYHSCAMSRPSA